MRETLHFCIFIYIPPMIVKATMLCTYKNSSRKKTRFPLHTFHSPLIFHVNIYILGISFILSFLVLYARASGSSEFSPWYILNKGSHTVHARLEKRPFWYSGVGTRKWSLTEHSITWPLIDVSSRHLLYALTMVDIGVMLWHKKTHASQFEFSKKKKLPRLSHTPSKIRKRCLFFV